MEFSEPTKDLISAFLKRERCDYPPSTPERQAAWVDFRLQKILEFEGKTSNIRIVSLGNTGVVIRELQLEPPSANWDWKAGELVVTLCTCGINSCWGSIEMAESKPMRLETAPGA